MHVSELINKVANSGIVTLNLEDYLPKNVVAFDLAQFLFMGLILKEKDYRAALKEFDFTPFEGKQVAVFCSADAIIPHWAYMLAGVALTPYSHEVYFGTVAEIKEKIQLANIRDMDTTPYSDKRMVIKGCGEEDMSAAAYLEVTKKLLPVAKSIMYGEPCSTVPIYKQARKI